MSKALLARGLLFFVLSIGLLFSGVSQAEVTLTGQSEDTGTQGNWLGNYGCCFFLLPDAVNTDPEEDVGPGFYGDNPGQYSTNNCFGGLLFDEDLIDWRIYRTFNGNEVAAKACVLIDPVDDEPGWGAPLPDGAQWNPCRSENWASTWDSEDSISAPPEYDPLGLELEIDFVGSIRIAYYFVDAAHVCRSQELKLYVNNELMTDDNPDNPLIVSDFAAGKYVVFDLEGLEGETNIRLEIVRIEEPGECTMGCGIIYGYNSHLSGVFIDCAVPLQVTKTCQVETPPGDFDCKKPIDALTMIWNGDGPIRIKAWKGQPENSELLEDFDNIKHGDEVTVSGYTGSPNDVIWEIFEAANCNNSKIGESIFHLSCSDKDMNGPEDCGKPQGDGKGKSGFINDWLFEGMVSAGGTLNCTSNPLAQASDCEFVIIPPSCETEGKPTSLTFKYTGGGCDASYNGQGRKAKCSGGFSSDPDSVYVTAGDKKFKKRCTVTPENVNLNEEFTITPYKHKKFSSNLVIKLESGNETEVNKIHASCSKPLAVGDVFGSLTLVAINDNRLGGHEVTYTYKVSNTGSVAVKEVTVVDDKLGEVPGSPIDLIEVGESKVLTETAFVSETTENTVTVAGSLDTLYGVEGWCAARGEATATVTLVEPLPGPVECTTKVQAMLLKYIGPDISGANVKIIADKFKDEPVVYSSVDLTSGTILSAPAENGWTIDAKAHGENELGAKTRIYIYSDEEEIHTSCSTPFVAGEPAPLNNPKGDPSPNWSVVDFVQK